MNNSENTKKINFAQTLKPHVPLKNHNLLKDLKLKIDLHEEILKGIRK